MKPQLNHLLLALALTGGAAAQTPTNFQYGANFGTSGQHGDLIPWSWSSEKSLQLSAYDGSLLLYNSQEGLVRGTFDGGIITYGNPVDIVLGSDESAQIDRGSFRVWGSDSYLYGSSTAKPLFSIAHPSGDAKFEGIDVEVNDGTLKVSGSPVLTQAFYSTTLAMGNGSAGTGSVAIGFGSPSASSGSVALGAGIASGQNSLASGVNTKALGRGSVAIGEGAEAWGWYSAAFGTSHAKAAFSFAASHGGVLDSGLGGSALSGGVAAGVHSAAIGEGTSARQFSSIALGMHNVDHYGGSTTAWVGTEPLFTIGNGAAYGQQSDALKMLKNGQTTLKNKKWNSSTPLADPDPNDSADANGDALVVNGHTRLKGKVLIQPQGDISMGIFTSGETP